MIGLAEDDPAHVRPERALVRRVRVAGLIGFRVMNAMRAHPEHGSAFERHGAADGEKVFEPARTLIGLMGVQAMVAQADAPADRHPVKGQRHEKGFPTETKEGGKGADVKATRINVVTQLIFLAVGEVDGVFTHCDSADVE